MRFRRRLSACVAMAMLALPFGARAGVVLVPAARMLHSPAPGLVLPALPGFQGQPPAAAALDARLATPPEAALVASVILAQARVLPSAAPLAAYAARAGLGFSVTSFAGKALMGLESENLAQYAPGDRRVYLNWDYVGGDRRTAEDAGLSPARGRVVTALLAAPVLAHEWRHAELRDAFGSDFPALSEEEILTHLDQAAVMGDALARPELAGREDLLERLYLYPHSKRLLDLRRRGFGPFAEFVLFRYRGVSPTLDDHPRSAADARESLARLEASSEAPRGWLEKARANVGFWESPAKVERLTAFLQQRIDAAAAALRR